MPALVVLGAQWGDEGKGKAVDLLSQEAHAVIRCQGGDNAGHTVITDKGTFKLHLVPSGILWPNVWCFLGNGCVVDPWELVTELGSLRARGVDVSYFRVSALAHVVMPWHRELDRLGDGVGMATKLGTTGRGIGPCYADKMLRRGLRMADLLEPDLDLKLARLHALKSAEIDMFQPRASVVLPPPGKLADALRLLGGELRDFIADTDAMARKFANAGEDILLEGAQGTMLDIDFGTYPYVTSSSTTAAGAFAGSGLPPRELAGVIGVAKAYVTRVGEGPMPSEMPAPLADTVRQRGMEFGVTTGRPRRCGWFDAPQAKYACEVNGIDGIILTKLDVLTGMGPIKVVTSYEFDNDGRDDLPARLYGSPKLTPIYTEVPGWDEDIAGVRDWSKLPDNARRYVELLQRLVGVEIVLVATGPHRDDIIDR